MKKHIAGFTLIELMIVVVIVGVLAAIAIPGYSSYIKKGSRAQAKSVMLDISQLQERYYTNNGTYLAVAAAPTIVSGWQNYSGSSMTSRKYNISVAAGTIANTAAPIGTSFTITATPSNGFSDATCGVLKLDSTGAKSSTNNTACW